MNKNPWMMRAGPLQRLWPLTAACKTVAVVLLNAALVLPTWAQAPNAIESVTGSVQGGSEVIRIDLKEALTAVPTGFQIQTPARIALDFPGVSNSMGRSALELNLGNLRSANVVQAGERTRVVLNLKASTAYTAQIQGKSLLITLDPVAVATPSPVVAPVFAENRNRDTLPLKDIDFRRGIDASGRIVVDLGFKNFGFELCMD